MTMRIAAVGAALVFAISCGGESVLNPASAASDTPVPGTLVVSLTTPNTDDGALLISLEGQGVSNIRALDGGHHLFVQATDSTATAIRIALIGDRLTGPVLAVDVPDVRRLDSYSATLMQVSDEDNELRSEIGVYELVLEALGSGVPAVERTSEQNMRE
jgi:hypothetical protein